MITEQQKALIISHLRTLSPQKIGVFGSYARSEQKAASDLDILIFLDSSNKVSLLDIIGVEQELSDALGIKVDLVTERSLNPLVRPYVEKDLQFILQ
ncbi:MAG: nucleotidyltransferase family protein [Cyclobacteriaceae bacterium]|nr:nucleotidyltransferase family protein [Cyclobacteriaceae bacterium]